MSSKYVSFVRQIAPDLEQSGSREMLRSSLGYTSKGPKVAWVKLPSHMNSTGFKSKPGYGRLYFDWHGPTSGLLSTINLEATRLLKQPSTQFIGRAKFFDQTEHVVYGHAWLVPDEGSRCPAVRVGEGHDVDDVREWVFEEYGDEFAVHRDRSGLWIVQTLSDEDAVAMHTQWLDDLREDDPDQYTTLGEITKQPPKMLARLAHCKMRWG